MLRGFLGAALCTLLAIAALNLWPSYSPQFDDALTALASVPGPDTEELTFVVAHVAGELLTAWMLVALAFILALGSAVLLTRPWSRWVALGALAGVLVALVWVIVAVPIGTKIGQFRAQGAVNSAKGAPSSPP